MMFLWTGGSGSMLPLPPVHKGGIVCGSEKTGLSTSPHRMRGVLISSPSITFVFGITASQFGASSGGPSTGRASCSCGTSPLIREASPATDIDRSYPISMTPPSAFSTDIASVLRLVSGTTGRTFLRRIGWVNLLDLDAKPLRFVGDEGCQLGEAPTILHAVVFAGGCPTTCACRALADPGKGFNFDRAHALFMCMGDNLARKFVVDVFHPPDFLALAFLDGA